MSELNQENQESERKSTIDSQTDELGQQVDELYYIPATAAVDVEGIKRAVNRKSLKLVALSVAVMLLFYGGVRYVAEPLISSCFYDPSKTFVEYQDNTLAISQLFLDATTYGKLHFPGWTVAGTQVVDRGFGTYDIAVDQVPPMEPWQNVKAYQDTVVRGKLSASSGWSDNTLVANGFYHLPNTYAFFGRDGVPHMGAEWNGKEWAPQGQSASGFQAVKSQIQELPKVTNVLAYVTFLEDMNMDEFLKQVYHAEPSVLWAGVRSQDLTKEDIQQFQPLGISFNGGLLVGQDTLSKEEYPNFELYWERENNFTGELLSEHFKSRVRYMGTRDDFLTLIGACNGTTPDYYEKVLDYVEQTGVKTYGVLVVADRDTLLKFLKKDFVYSVYVEDVNLSIQQQM